MYITFLYPGIPLYFLYIEILCVSIMYIENHFKAIQRNFYFIIHFSGEIFSHIKGITRKIKTFYILHFVIHIWLKITLWNCYIHYTYRHLYI